MSPGNGLASGLRKSGYCYTIGKISSKVLFEELVVNACLQASKTRINVSVKIQKRKRNYSSFDVFKLNETIDSCRQPFSAETCVTTRNEESLPSKYNRRWRVR